MRYWFDTEFIEAGAEAPIHLLSIGIVSEDGRTYYAQLHHKDFPKAGDWVACNVFPFLEHFDMGRQERSCIAQKRENHPNNASCIDKACPWKWRDDLRDDLRLFFDPEKYGKPEIWGYYADYDWVVLCQLFGTMMDLPKGWPMYCRDIKQWCDALGNPKLPPEGKDEHHALADARWNRQAWEFLSTYKPVCPCGNDGCSH